jgi:histidine triad (HIT) family protein
VPTIFTRIIDGERPGTFVWRDEQVVAFMSINPLARGHLLVVPIAEVEHWIDLDGVLAARLFEVARIVGIAQAAAFTCEKVGLIIAGYEVPHVHVHVIPTNTMSELNFANAARHVDPADLEAAAEAIRVRLHAAGHAEVASLT